MKLTDSILLQEVLSGHTSVVLQDEPKIIRNALTKHKVLMISDGPVDMYMPIINSWFERIGILLDLKLCTSHNFIAAPELFLNDSAVKIVGPALKSSASIIINEFLKFADRDKKQKIFFLTNSGDFVEYDAIERGKEFPELDFPSIDIPDIYGSGVTLQSISNACHFLYSCFEDCCLPNSAN